ncbi:MAG: protein kinase [Vicinamibacterales bacterium]
MLSPGRTLGHYRVTSQLGAGAMGAVYEARDDRLGRSVAIKVILAAHQDEDGRKRFLREAQAASALNHPNIVTVHEVGRDGDLDFMVMERIAGRTLREAIGSSGLPLRTALEYAAQIAGALAAAHDAGLVHRDLKPGNIMVTPRGLVKVLDFGLAVPTAASESSATVTSQGFVAGTVAYMSPEQAQGQTVDARSDVFAFGCVLYEMLTGRQAFHQANPIATLAAILHDEPAAIEANVAPRAVWRLIAKCLRKDPADRWQHLSDVKQLLDDLAKDDESPGPGPIDANRAATGGRQTSRWPALAAACAATAVLVLVGLRLAAPAAPARTGDDRELFMVTADGGLTASPAISRDGKFLAYASDRARNDNLDIWVQQIGGREPLRLTQDSADESEPAFSPDDAMIAFRSEKDRGGVYLVPALGGTPVLLAAGGRNPRFSPDGRWVAYSVGGGAVSTPGSAGVFVISAGGGAPRAIHPEMATATSPVWSPSGDRLLVLGRQDGAAPAQQELDWWILPIGDGAPQRSGAFARIARQKLMRPALPQVYPAPLDWRRAGSVDWILLSAFRGEAVNLWEIPLLGDGAAERLTHGPGLHQEGRWTGDARGLTFAAAELNFDVWLQPLDRDTGVARGDMRRVTDALSEDVSPSIDWNGRVVSYVRRLSNSWSVRTIDLASGHERAVLSSPTRLSAARLSGDGSRVLFTSTGYDLMSIPSGGGAAEKLCDRCGVAMGPSSDGRRTLYEPLENEDLLMYDADAKATVTLARRPDAKMILSSARFSQDGQWVAFHALRNATNTAQIWIVPVGSERPVPQTAWIAVSGGEALERDPAWSADGRFLYFISERDGFRCVWARQLDPATKRPAGDSFAVRHFHSARFSLRHVGSRGFLTGLTAGDGALLFAMGELKANVWLEADAR